MADPVTGLAIAAGAIAGKAVSQIKAANAQQEAIKLQSEQQQLQNQQKMLSNFDLMKRVLQRQEVQASAKGIALSSPSFEAIQRETFNVGAKQESNLAVEKSLLERNADIEKGNVRNTLYAQLFGDAEDMALSFAKLKGA